MPTAHDKLRRHELEMQDTLLRQMLKLEPDESITTAVAQLQTIIAGLDQTMTRREAEIKKLRSQLRQAKARG